MRLVYRAAAGDPTRAARAGVHLRRRRPPPAETEHGQGPGQEEGREEETREDAEGKARSEEGEESRPLSRLSSALPFPSPAGGRRVARLAIPAHEDRNVGRTLAYELQESIEHPARSRAQPGRF